MLGSLLSLLFPGFTNIYNVKSSIECGTTCSHSPKTFSPFIVERNFFAKGIQKNNGTFCYIRIHRVSHWVSNYVWDRHHCCIVNCSYLHWCFILQPSCCIMQKLRLRNAEEGSLSSFCTSLICLSCHFYITSTSSQVTEKLHDY